ncbi:MAG TPA: beta-ketoacyl-[acyl-carrier-protein] synthase family protein [Gemmatimonadales bacterium]|jgi:3-oxoacyl-[acyl-carrier-protein] synthase II|nr:beta-ketoacyl-[acyl-carrier-protein] synthase family protein [Gemmatimonadales bacterium]
MKRRVVVTGLGLVTPIGIGTRDVWTRLQDGHSAVQTITRFDPSPFRSHVAAQVDDFDPVAMLSAKQARRTDRCSQLALAASRLAIEDAALDLARETPDRVGVMMGTALGGVGFAEMEYRKYLEGGVRDVDPLLALTVFGGAISCNIAITHGIAGVNATNAMSCASGTLAIGEGFRAVANGTADVVLAGGSEAPLYPLCYGSFSLIRAMSTRNDDPATASRPFDANRDGFVMAEGSCVVILETLDHARARGAPIYAEICGFGLTNDAFHMTQPRPDGREAMRAMRLALAEADCTPDHVDWINAHGSSTPLNDATEARAIREVFGDATDRVPVSGTKGWHAHALGASGAIETAIVCLAIQRGWIPPTLNCITPDAAGSLRQVPPGGLRHHPRVVLKNSFGFGGANATLLLRDPAV